MFASIFVGLQPQGQGPQILVHSCKSCHFWVPVPLFDPYPYVYQTPKIGLRTGLCQFLQDSAPLICGLQGRWLLKDGTAVAEILDAVVLWDGGGATLLQQTGPSTICIQAPLGGWSSRVINPL
jgi:hypothetical protein